MKRWIFSFLFLCIFFSVTAWAEFVPEDGLGSKYEQYLENARRPVQYHKPPCPPDYILAQQCTDPDVSEREAMLRQQMQGLNDFVMGHMRPRQQAQQQYQYMYFHDVVNPYQSFFSPMNRTGQGEYPNTIPYQNYGQQQMRGYGY